MNTATGANRRISEYTLALPVHDYLRGIFKTYYAFLRLHLP